MSLLKLSKAVLLVTVGTLGTSIYMPAYAADEVNVSAGATVPGPGLAVHGYDVVSYHEDDGPQVGKAKYSHIHQGATYRFASRSNLRRFKANPAKYEPAYGGFCAYGVALGKKFDGDPNFWKIVDGRLYLNLNKDIQKNWSKDISGNVDKANVNWIDIEHSAVEDL